MPSPMRLLLLPLALVFWAIQSLAQNAPPETAPRAPEASAPAATRSASWGTGFVVAPGYLLTAHHVVRDHKRLLIGPVGLTSTGRPQWHAAELVKADIQRDLALLKIPDALALPALRLSPQPAIPIGLEALVIGFPQPRLQGSSRKITQGIVNGYRNNDSNQTEQGLLQISAEISQGNSGGPVLAADGTVIGMVQRKINASRVADRAQDLLVNVSYALRSSQLVDFLQDSPSPASLQNIGLHIVLRPHQIYEQAQASVLAVVGLTAPAPQTSAPAQ